MNKKELVSHIKKEHKRWSKGEKYLKPIQKLTCKDGTTLSVQASQMHYCSPRENDANWTHLEIGYPSVSPEGVSDWAQYFDGDYYTDSHTDSVYAYVPILLVLEYINFHGGIK